MKHYIEQIQTNQYQSVFPPDQSDQSQLHSSIEDAAGYIWSYLTIRQRMKIVKLGLPNHFPYEVREVASTLWKDLASCPEEQTAIAYAMRVI